jgi:hypothetical protein
MRRVMLAVAILALLGALAVACGSGEEATPTPTPSDAEPYQRLAELPDEAVLALAFPGVTFEPSAPSDATATFLVAGRPGARLEVLGRLTGHLTRSDQPQLAAFLYLKESSSGQDLQPALGLSEGLYMILVDIEGGQPVLGGLAVLEASANELLEVALAQEEGLLPFREEVDNPIANGAIRPTVASDMDNDGMDELILLDAGVSQGVESAAYLTFDWSGAGLRWRRIDADGASARIPGKAVLDYLAAVEAADATAEAWEGPPRAQAWEWLTTTPAAPISTELLAQLAPDGNPDAQATARRKLEATRALLESAYGLLSTDWQRRNPWTDFVYGFRNATGVRMEQLLPPRQEGERTVVEVVIIAASREGSISVDRRFRVTYTVVEEASGWRLDGADAREESLP